MHTEAKSVGNALFRKENILNPWNYISFHPFENSQIYVNHIDTTQVNITFRVLIF